jgi:hypothetical protein
MPFFSRDIAWKTSALTILPEAKHKRKRKSIALDNNLVIPPLPKKPKTSYIIKALVPKASYSSLKSNIKSSLNISLIKESRGI